MISETWTSWEQSYEYQTKIRGKWLRCCGRRCQRQQRDQEGKGMILYDGTADVIVRWVKPCWMTMYDVIVRWGEAQLPESSVLCDDGSLPDDCSAAVWHFNDVDVRWSSWSDAAWRQRPRETHSTAGRHQTAQHHDQQQRCTTVSRRGLHLGSDVCLWYQNHVISLHQEWC